MRSWCWLAPCSSSVHQLRGCWNPSLPTISQFYLIPLKINLYVAFLCIFSSAASWLSVFLTASNSSFIILCFCSHTRWNFYPWNSRRVTPNARLPTSDAKRNFQQSFFFLCVFNPMLAADVSGFFRDQAATNSHSVRSVHCFQQKGAMVPLLLFRLLKVEVFF